MTMATEPKTLDDFETIYRQRRADNLRQMVAWIEERDAWADVLSVGGGTIHVDSVAALKRLCAGCDAIVKPEGSGEFWWVLLPSFSVICVAGRISGEKRVEML